MLKRSAVLARLAVALPLAAAFAACSDQRSPTETTSTAPTTAVLSKGETGPSHAGAIVAHDACEPNSFNAGIGEGTCVKHGNVTLDEFVAELGATQTVQRWNFTPTQLTARLGVDLLGNNVGGEEHTFTPVKEFGGGFIDFLNGLAGTPVKAPECLTLDEDDLVASGDKYLIEAEELADVVDGSGVARVQCCVHPWMRATVRMQR